MRANNEARSIRESGALCLHNMRTDYRILCDDCHDDERRKARRVRVSLFGRELCDDCHDDERRKARRVRASLFGRELCDDCHDDERREARRVRASLFGANVSRCLSNPPWRQKGEFG